MTIDKMIVMHHNKGRPITALNSFKCPRSCVAIIIMSVWT